MRQKKLSQWNFVRLTSQDHWFSQFRLRIPFLLYNLGILFCIIAIIIYSSSSIERIIQDLNPKGTSFKMGSPHSDAARHWVLRIERAIVNNIIFTLYTKKSKKKLSLTRFTYQIFIQRIRDEPLTSDYILHIASLGGIMPF